MVDERINVGIAFSEAMLKLAWAAQEASKGFIRFRESWDELIARSEKCDEMEE